MKKQRFLYARFCILWMTANVVGFVIGSELGATNHGMVPGAVPGYVGLVVGDLIFGAVFGFAQWLVLSRTTSIVVSASWVISSSLGFMLGARSGALLTFRLTNEWLAPSVVFGIFMGVSVGVATMWSLGKNIAWSQLLRWPIICVLAWVLGERIAFASDFARSTVPLVALAIAGVTMMELLRLQTQLSSEPAIQTDRTRKST